MPEEFCAICLKKFDYITQCEVATSGFDALELMAKKRPDVIFLDVQMPKMNGFQFIEKLKHLDINPEIIFTTAYNQYALSAIKEHAFDYLLKPIDPEDLEESMRSFIVKFKDQHISNKLDDLLLNSSLPEKIRLNTRSGFILVNQKDILYCQADSNYTIVHLTYDRKEVSSLTLGKLEEKLSLPIFKRVGRSYIVNIQFLYKVDRKTKTCFLDNHGEIHKIPIPDGVRWD